MISSNEILELAKEFKNGKAINIVLGAIEIRDRDTVNKYSSAAVDLFLFTLKREGVIDNFSQEMALAVFNNEPIVSQYVKALESQGVGYQNFKYVNNILTVLGALWKANGVWQEK